MLFYSSVNCSFWNIFVGGDHTGQKCHPFLFPFLWVLRKFLMQLAYLPEYSPQTIVQASIKQYICELYLWIYECFVYSVSPYYKNNFYFMGFTHLCQQEGQWLYWAARLSCPLCQLLASPGAVWLGSEGFPLCCRVARWWRATAGILLLLTPNYNCLAVVQHASVIRQAAAAVITHPKLISAQSAKCLLYCSLWKK